MEVFIREVLIMAPWIWVAGLIYLLGFLMIFFLNVMEGPVTPGLSLVRAVVWPYFIVTGKPEGERAPMD